MNYLKRLNQRNKLPSISIAAFIYQTVASCHNIHITNSTISSGETKKVIKQKFLSFKLGQINLNRAGDRLKSTALIITTCINFKRTTREYKVPKTIKEKIII